MKRPGWKSVFIEQEGLYMKQHRKPNVRVHMVFAVKVAPLNNYNIVVEFNTGEIKIYNCYPLLSIPLFAKLKNKDIFMTAHIDETGVVCWDNATDIPSEELYNNSVDMPSSTLTGFRNY